MSEMRPPIHPGEHLAEDLTVICITPTELARQIRVPANRITQIIQGKRAITGDTALRLARWFGNSPQYWMNLQANYELRLAMQQSKSEIESISPRELISCQ